jgi:hypothetical protein
MLPLIPLVPKVAKLSSVFHGVSNAIVNNEQLFDYVDASKVLGVSDELIMFALRDTHPLIKSVVAYRLVAGTVKYGSRTFQKRYNWLVSKALVNATLKAFADENR